MTINDLPDTVKSLIDTGSDYSLIKSSVAEKYGLPVVLKTANFMVFGNSQCTVNGGDTTAVIKIDVVREPLKLMVVEDNRQYYDAIGRSLPIWTE